jgi:RND family efflux transporter MFP subunit
VKRKVIPTLVILLVIGAAAGGYYYWQRSASAPAIANVQTTTVRRGSLAATVNAAGNVAAARVGTITAQTSGKVTQVNVKISDRVKAGQTLVQLDLTDLNNSLRAAQLSLQTAQNNFDTAKAKNATNANALIIAKANLEKARISLHAAQADYDTIAWRAGSAVTSQATALQQATIDYQSALASYNTTVATISDTDLKNSQNSLDQAKLNVEIAQLNLDRARLVAPFDGIITAVNINVGDNANASTTTTSATNAIAMYDPSRLQISVTVSEVDIAKVKVGQKATVLFDALSGKTYGAEVTTIYPAATVTQGVVNYIVILTLVNPDESVRPGMTANLTIEVERRDDVLLVPTRAIRAQGNQRIATVQYKGQSIQTPVTTGLSNDTSIEVVNGLQEGDVVVVGQTTTRQSPGGIGLPGLGPGR